MACRRVRGAFIRHGRVRAYSERGGGGGQTRGHRRIGRGKPGPGQPRARDRGDGAGRMAIVLVHKTPTCGCCGAWVEHMRHAGFTVEVDERDDLEPIRKQLGVPYGKGSCHTAEVGGYVVEGHVPAEDVKRLLAERPKARGLVVPGMPMGSPGMESPDGRVQPYTVELIGMEGATSAFARHGE